MHLDGDVFAELGRQVTHDARQLLPRISDRLHARLHHLVLNLSGDTRQALQRHVELGIIVASRNFEQLIAGEDEL